jgi:trans-aconitate methyltransferase
MDQETGTIMTTSIASPSAPAPAAGSVSMRMRELVFGAACSAAVRTAAELRIADALGDAPATAEDLAATLGVQSRELARLLRALACYGVFAEDATGRFAHTELSRLLREDAPDSLRYIALWCTEPWTWQAWPHLTDAVRTGRSVFPEVFGEEFFAYLHGGAGESARVFDKAMTQSSRQSADDVAEFVDLAGAASVVDIGGGQGHVLAALLERHPQLRGTLLDLPAVVANADPRLLEGGALSARAGIIAGDCRAAVPVQADLYIIKNVLEWDDESTRRTLRNIVEAARPGARVLAIENLVDESPSMKFTTAMDLMLLLNVGGAKHTKASLSALMTEAGLRIKDVRPVNPYLHAFDSTV